MLKERHFGPVWFLPSESKGRYPDCHSIYIEGPGVLIDPASDRERLIRIRNDHGINQVWLSHAHEDHIKHLGLFDDLPLSVSELDAPSIADVETMLDAYGVEGDTRDYWRDYILDGFGFRPRKASRFLRPGEVIDLKTVTVEVIGTPGHTQGHLAFFFREYEILFMGDYDLTKFGPWYADEMSRIEDTIESVEKLRRRRAKVWLTSHETGIFERDPGNLWDEYLDVIRVREEKLLDLLKEPHTFEDIVQASIVYWRPREPRAFYDLGERGHMARHLNKLLSEGRAIGEGDRFVRV